MNIRKDIKKAYRLYQPWSNSW